MKRINFYCTPSLFDWLQKKFGGLDGRSGRMSANIERMLWAQIREKEAPPTPPEEKEAI